MPIKPKHYILLTAGIAISLLILFHKYLFFSFFFIFDDVGSDTMSLFYPNLLDDVRNLRNEGLVFWSFSKGMGLNSWSENFIDPLHLILMILGEKYLAYGLGWIAVVKVAAVSFFSYYFFKFQGLHRNAILLGTILMTFMGYLITGTTWYGHATNIMHMMMFLLGIEWMISRNRWWVLSIAALMLLGPPLFFMTEYAIIYGVLRFTISEKLNLATIRAFFKRLWKPALAGTLIATPFLGSIINRFVNSPRVGGDASFAHVLSDIGVFSVNEAGHLATILARFFSNDILGSPNNFTGWKNTLEAPLFYCGLLTLLLVPQLFSFLKIKQKLIFGGMLGIFALTLIFPWFRNAFYLFQGEYYKGALSFFIPFTLIWMAVLAFHYISKSGKIHIPLLIGTIVVLIGTLFSIPSISQLIRVDASVQFQVVVFLLVYAGGLFTLNRLKNKNTVVHLLLVVALIEGGIFSYNALNDRSAIDINAFENREFYNDNTVEAIKYLKSEDPGFYRVEKLFGSFLSNGLNDSQAQGYYDTKTYRSHNHNNYVEFLKGLTLLDPSDESATRWIGGLWTAEDIHPLITMKYLLARPGQSDQPKSGYYNSIGELNGINIYKSKYYLPLGIPFNSYILKSEMKDDLDYFRIVEAMNNGVIIDDKDVGLVSNMKKYPANRISGYLAPSRLYNTYKDKCLKITSHNQSHIQGTINITEPNMVYFSIPYDVGWSASANGKSTPLTKVNYGMTGMYLDPGQYNISLRYRPPYFMIGCLLFLLGVGGMVYLSYKSRNDKVAPLLPIPENVSFQKIEKQPEKSVVKKRTYRKKNKKRKR
ncbi:MAG: YfhO family protein [Saprospiraceae bacterium]|nr:YfhO family protein [Saprospiraceae bacterium]